MKHFLRGASFGAFTSSIIFIFARNNLEWSIYWILIAILFTLWSYFFKDKEIK